MSDALEKIENSGSHGLVDEEEVLEILIANKAAQIEEESKQHPDQEAKTTAEVKKESRPQPNIPQNLFVVESEHSQKPVPSTVP